MSVQTKANFPFLGIALLKSFTKKELNRFKQFLLSPYFNTDGKLNILLNTLVENVLLENTFTDRLQCHVFEIVFEQNIGRKQLELKQKKTLAAKLSKLTRLTQKFLVTEGLNKYEIHYNELLYRQLLDKKQFNMFFSAYTKNKKIIKSKQRKSIDDFEHIYKRELFYLDYLFYTGRLLKKGKNNLPELIYHLDIQYILNRLSLFKTIFRSKTAQNENYNTIPFNTIDSLLHLPQYKQESIINVLNSNYEFLKKPSKQGYYKLLNVLETGHDKIPLSELQEAYESLLNFMTTQKRKGVQNSNKELSDLYYLMDQKNLLLVDSLMHSVKLKNLIGTSLKVGAFKKAKYFLEKYIPYVVKKDRESVYNFCQSGIFFYQKDYEKALEYLTQVESINLVYEVNCRFVIMKIYYEIDQEYNERTIRLFRSAEEFFKTNKSLTIIDKKSYKNFIQILVNLYRIKHKEGKMTIAKLKEKLELHEFNADKKWLLEKMAEFEKN